MARNDSTSAFPTAVWPDQEVEDWARIQSVVFPWICRGMVDVPSVGFSLFVSGEDTPPVKGRFIEVVQRANRRSRGTWHRIRAVRRQKGPPVYQAQFCRL